MGQKIDRGTYRGTENWVIPDHIVLLRQMEMVILTEHLTQVNQ